MFRSRYLLGFVIIAGLAGCTNNGGPNGKTMAQTMYTKPANQFALMQDLGRISLKNHDYSSAARFYYAAHKMKPHDVKNTIDLASAVSHQGAARAAVGYYQVALKDSPKNVKALRGLGNALLRDGNSELALQQYQKALEISPASFDVKNNIGYLLDITGNHTQAQNCYRQVIKRNSKDTIAENNLAISQAMTGHYREAVDTMQRIQASAQSENDIVKNNIELIDRLGAVATTKKTTSKYISQARAELQQLLMPEVGKVAKLSKSSLALAKQLCAKSSIERKAVSSAVATSHKARPKVTKPTNNLVHKKSISVKKKIAAIKTKARVQKTASTQRSHRAVKLTHKLKSNKGYSIVLLKTTSLAKVNHFKKDHGLNKDIYLMKKKHNDITTYILSYGLYHHARDARKVRSELSQAIRAMHPSITRVVW